MQRRAGFTLIEMLAVVAIFALLAGIAIPSLSLLSGRKLHAEAERLAGQLDLARQRAVMTGVPHRIAIDLDAGSYGMEWYVPEPEPEAEDPSAPLPAEVAADDLAGGTPLPLAAPRGAERAYRSLPGPYWRPVSLDEEIDFARLETGDGSIESGESFVGFDRDGTATYARIVLTDTAENQLRIDVLPLADAVRIDDASP